jgi:hypothetical protein
MLPRVAITHTVDVIDLVPIAGEDLAGLWVLRTGDHHAVQNQGMGAGELSFTLRMSGLELHHFEA